MADPVTKKIQKLFDRRLKAETEVKKIQNVILNNSERRVRVARLVMYCDELMTKAFSKNEQHLEFAKKNQRPGINICRSGEVVTWTIMKFWEVLENTSTNNLSQKNFHKTRKTTTVRTKFSKASSSKLSKTSSQRQRDLIIAQQRRDDIQKQNDASLRLAKQKQELDFGRRELEVEKKEEQERHRKHQEWLPNEQELRVLEPEEENRKRLAEATLAELELREDLSDLHLDFHDTLSRLSAASHMAEVERIHEWINNSPNVVEKNIQSTSETPVTSAPNATLNIYTLVAPRKV